MAKKFVHLHVHTEYSLLDGLSNIPKLFNHIKESGMDSLAVTDHGAMYGVIDFYKEALKHEVKPIIGMEGYTTDVDMHQRPERSKFQNFHLLLLAKNREGYENLMKITSVAHIEGYYYRPRVDRETLAKYAKGLICTSACAQGELAQALIADDYKKAVKTAEWFLDVFGQDYYLEVQKHNYSDYVGAIENPKLKEEVLSMAENEKKILAGVKKLSREMGIPIVATNDAHYIKKEDATAQDALVCIATGKNVSEVERLRFIDTPTFYITNPDEMSELFADLPEALENTVKIAQKCETDITLGKWYFPEFPVPDKLAPDEYLKKIVRQRLAEKIKEPDKETKERLEYELEIICTKGYAPYFLIVMDMVNWANSKGIITNTRGSAAGSLVSYVLGITTVNPLIYNLPFERFLNPFRPSPPDIDFDVADDRREDVIGYISDTYGHDRVAQICTFGRMLARAAVRDVARVLGFPYAIGDRIAKLIPLGSQGFPMTIEKALSVSSDLKTLYNEDKDAKKIIDLAKEIEGSARHISVHAAGVVVAPSALTGFTPIQLEPSGDKVITQYEMHACEDVGLIKFDILGIRNLAILGSSIAIVEEMLGKKIDVAKIPLDDKKTFEMLSRGETMGVFQLGGSGMTRYLKDLKPSRIEDLMAMVALYRPGPMSVIPEYIARKNNPKLIKYLDPRMKEFLDKSYGLIVYQDDLLFCAIVLAGYSWEEADKFRKAVGKKIPAEMAAQKKHFVEGIISNGQTAEFAEMLWQLFEPFQAYGFNKAHAASYGMVAYQTAYMKANYPVEFMNALLTAESDDTDKVSAAVNECRRMKIKVLPPDINESDIGFKIVEAKDSLEGKAIRFGLSAIKNVGDAAIEAILAARAAAKFNSFADFLSKVDTRRVNKKVLESLIKVGALSDFGSRAALLFAVDELRAKVSKPKSLENQEGLFGEEDLIKNPKSFEAQKLDTGVSEFSQEELQTLERQLLGLSLSAKPVGELLTPLIHEATHKIFEISPHETFGESVRVAAVVKEVRIVVTRNSGQEMAFVRAEDDTGSIDLVVFPKIFKSTRNYWVDYKPLLISGRVDSREETPALIVEAIQTAEGRTDKENEVFIRIPKATEAEKLRKLRDLLVANPGQSKVTLVFEGKKGRMNLPVKIAWSEELARQISGVLDSNPS
ncbi:MAG TPA: DNA polymerase III subunit alpha [Patescibacteria group bacterium]|uniref:DNA polymerase III subunit alpha n=1 Tax=Candidatus Woesebacteria bacterium RBG_13_46_13 TaxID=1802479 RepID=A0A1F7X3W2_9BACT|nr:MAG: DNA polymerase III subunit alpha [Candidatus Woesebacteria bacterium RBG_13_46_13]HJX59212.1 DNA polymerase III subunit alpha [Patescibacteria group bacterium]